MAGSATDYIEGKILDLIFSNTAYTIPTTLYIGLHTDSNTAAQRDAGTVSEVSGNAYARVAVTNNSTNWPAASGTSPKSKSNGTAINFPTPTPAGWGTVTSFGVYDAASAGNLLFWGDLSASKTINAGDTVTFNTSSLTITCD